jgi:hypothetical protein
MGKGIWMEQQTRVRRDGTIPKNIKEASHSSLWGEKFNDMHIRNQMFSLVICAGVGKGKSWASLWIANHLDRNMYGEPRFNVDRVCFSAREFASLVSQQWPKGTAFIIDDAGLTAYSGDAVTREVKELSKIFMSIRSKNYCIIWNIPNFEMLASNVQAIVQNYGEMIGLIREKKETIMKFQEMQCSPKVKKIYFHSPTVKRKYTNPTTGLEITETVKDPFVHIPLPPKELIEAYEIKKHDSMQKFYAGSIDRMDGNQKKKKELDFKQIYDYVIMHRNNYMTDGEIDVVKIRYNGIIGYDGAKGEVKLADAKMVAKRINSEIPESK